jgi:NADP-reducing hydrogenase subunit HndB
LKEGRAARGEGREAFASGLGRPAPGTIEKKGTLMGPTKKLQIQDLAKIREKTRSMMTIRDSEGRAKITVHMGTCGIAAGAREIMDALLDEIEKRGIKDVIVATSGCAGLCNREPMVTVELKDQPPVKYIDLAPDKIRRIFVEHVLGGHIVLEYALAVGSETLY